MGRRYLREHAGELVKNLAAQKMTDPCGGVKEGEFDSSSVIGYFERHANGSLAIHIHIWGLSLPSPVGARATNCCAFFKRAKDRELPKDGTTQDYFAVHVSDDSSGDKQGPVLIGVGDLLEQPEFVATGVRSVARLQGLD